MSHQANTLSHRVHRTFQLREIAQCALPMGGSGAARASRTRQYFYLVEVGYADFAVIGQVLFRTGIKAKPPVLRQAVPTV